MITWAVLASVAVVAFGWVKVRRRRKAAEKSASA